MENSASRFGFFWSACSVVIFFSLKYATQSAVELPALVCGTLFACIGLVLLTIRGNFKAAIQPH